MVAVDAVLHLGFLQITHGGVERPRLEAQRLHGPLHDCLLRVGKSPLALVFQDLRGMSGTG